MFLHIKKLVVLTLALFCISGAMAADTAYKENEHYKVISDKVLEHKEVREFFILVRSLLFTAEAISLCSRAFARGY